MTDEKGANQTMPVAILMSDNLEGSWLFVLPILLLFYMLSPHIFLVTLAFLELHT